MIGIRRWISNMNIEPTNISQKNSAPATQKRLPADNTVEKPVKEPDSRQIKALVQDAQNKLNNVDLHFSVHQSSGTIMVTVTEKASGKIIREIPSSETLYLAAKLDEMVGMIFDQKG